MNIAHFSITITIVLCLYFFDTLCSPSSDALFELYSVISTVSKCLNALNRCHIIGLLNICVNKQLNPWVHHCFCMVLVFNRYFSIPLQEKYNVYILNIIITLKISIFCFAHIIQAYIHVSRERRQRMAQIIYFFPHDHMAKFYLKAEPHEACLLCWWQRRCQRLSEYVEQTRLCDQQFR